MDFGNPQEAKEKFEDLIFALWNLFDRQPDECKRAGFKKTKLGKGLLTIEWEHREREKTIHLIHSGLGIEGRRTIKCDVCGADNITNYFTSKRDG